MKASNPDDDGFCKTGAGFRFMDDYTGNYWSGTTLYASWMDSRGGAEMSAEAGGWVQQTEINP